MTDTAATSTTTTNSLKPTKTILPRTSDPSLFNKQYRFKLLPISSHKLHSGQRDFICGFGAASIETLVTYPLNKLIFRQQLHNINANQAIGQLVSEGFRFLYRGLLPPLCQKAATRAIMFGMYDQYSAMADCDADRSFSLCHAIAAFLAGSSEAVLVPFERIQTLMQSERFHGRFKNTIDAFHALRAYGFTEYYRGMTLILMRNGPASVLFFACREPLHDYVMHFVTSSYKHNEMTELTCHFVAGSVLGATLSTLFFPMNVVKARLQSRLGGTFESPFDGFRQVLKERNYQIREIFRGVHLNYTRSVLTWGITNTVYELLKWTLYPEK